MSDEADAIDDGFEAMLASLRPTAATADPVAAAYAAGRAAGRSGVNRLRGVAAAALFVAVAGHWRWRAPEPASPHPTVVVVAPMPLPFPAAVRPTELVRIEQALLDRGLDGLPPASRRAVYPDRAPAF